MVESPGRSVIVLGGGFAGMAAACRLAAAGLAPLLLEGTSRLGGRAASFVDRRSGERIDYGQHVSMRCCTATHGFLLRLGLSDAIVYQDRLDVSLLVGSSRASLRSTPGLPDALHMAPALLRYRPLSLTERLRTMRAGLALRLPGNVPEVCFDPWLRTHGQTDRTMARFWNPICVATLNAHATDVSLRAARRVIRDGVLLPEGAGLGFFTRPLGDIFDRAADYIRGRGGGVRVDSRVTRIRVGGDRLKGVELEDGTFLRSSGLIAAVPPWDLHAMLDGSEAEARIGQGRSLDWAPIVDVHLWLHRINLREPFYLAIDGELQAVFDLSQLHHSRPDGVTHLVVSLSAAASWIDRDPTDIVNTLLHEIRERLPEAGEATLGRSLVLKHRRATFVPRPGHELARPVSKTGIEGLYLAGDWTASGWPSTIEGAIRSGVAAAGRVEVAAEVEDEGGGAAENRISGTA